METSGYTFNDFLTYLVLYAANIDANLKASEEEHIIFHCGDESYHKMRDLFETHNDVQSIQFLQALKSNFAKEENFQERVHASLEELFKSDGDYSPYEKASQHILERILK